VTDLASFAGLHGIVLEENRIMFERVLIEFWSVCWMSCAFANRPSAVFATLGIKFNAKFHEPFPPVDIKNDPTHPPPIIEMSLFPGIESLVTICKAKVMIKTY
jgi:hypothetical protein